jgi:hypothetical protein
VEVTETLVSKGLTVNSQAKDSIEDIDQYVEGFYMILWNHAFPSFFRKGTKYSRLIPFLENEGTQDAVKRLVYRYTKWLGINSLIHLNMM